MLKTTSLLLCLSVIYGLIGCGPQAPQPSAPSTKVDELPSQQANPAAQYCGSLKGTLALDTGICTLPSGEAIEHWTLYNRDHPMAAGMANPASEYCLSIGGELVIENHAGGQVGICHLPGGKQIEEWQLYRQDNPLQPPQTEMANPAAQYCESLKGTLALDTGICTLPDGEAIEHWQLYRRDHKQD